MELKNESKATARPWRIATSGFVENCAVFASEKFFCVADCNNILSKSSDVEINRANTALIVRAVNEYDTLVAVVEAAEMAWQHGQITGESKLKVDTALSALNALRNESK